MWPEKTLHFLHRRKKGLVCSGLQLAVFLFFEVAKIGFFEVATGIAFHQLYFSTLQYSVINGI